MKANQNKRGAAFFVCFALVLMLLPACHRTKRVAVSGLGFSLSQPSNLTAKAISSYGVTLLWIDTNNNEDGYAIERSADGINFTQIDVTAADATTYRDTVPVTETLYYYQIRAFAGTVFSDYSNLFPVAVMAPPTGLKAEGVKSNLAYLTWEDNTGYEDGYLVLRSEDGLNYRRVGQTPMDATFAYDRRAVPEKVYYYKVKAFNLAGGLSDLSDDSMTNTPVTPWSGVVLTRGKADTQCMIQTDNLGFMGAGSFENPKTGLYSIFAVRMSAGGQVNWAKSFDGGYNDYGRCVVQTHDMNFLVAGDNTQSGFSGSDLWLIKLDGDGNTLWEKTYGGSDNDHLCAVAKTNDNGFIVAGFTSSFGAGSSDGWILRLDSEGAVIWQKTYGGPLEDKCAAVAMRPNGNIVAAGTTFSYGAAQGDFWVFELDENGVVQWEKCMGDSRIDTCRAMTLMADGGIVIAGDSETIRPFKDALILNLTQTGTLSWQKRLSSNNDMLPKSLCALAENRIGMAGATNAFGASDMNQWLVNFSFEGNVIWEKTYTGVAEDQLFSLHEAMDRGLITGGILSSPIHGIQNMGVLRLNPDGSAIFKEWSQCEEKDVTSLRENTGFTTMNTSATVTDTTVTPFNSEAQVRNILNTFRYH